MFHSAVKTMVARPLLCWRHLLRPQTQSLLFSSSVAPSTVVTKPEEPLDRPTFKPRRSKSMITAAFQSLNEPDCIKETTKSLDDLISDAKSVNALLSVADEAEVTKKHALKIVSVLAEWSTDNKAKINEFESDARFHKLCRMLGHNYKQKTSGDVNIEGGSSEDLATVLEVTGDDEAAKLVASISLPQMIKVMSTLAQKKRRSTPLLRALTYNLCRDTKQLNVKQSADLLYSMAVLNFPDANLLDKVRNDLAESLPTNQKAAPVGSILTSLGLLRHKDAALLDTVSEWVNRNIQECRPQDLVSLLLTLAHVGHTPSTADSLLKLVCERLTGPQDVPTLSAWLEVVWALAVMSRASTELLQSVLDPKFQSGLGAEPKNLPVTTKLKLLNINAVAKFEVPGPLMEDPASLGVTLTRSKNKEQLVQSVLETLTNLLPSATYLKSSVDSGMGFLIGAKKDQLGMIAFLVWDYADLCRGATDPTGPNMLAMRLLQRQGLKVCPIPHTEFNPRETLVQRVQYLERKIKTLAKEK
ncbi:hypothetical protein B566_EDAN006704 [Ephemera danica]|nr:hypothetical protein B566_EDAN006704 [Ephemera danica]